MLLLNPIITIINKEIKLAGTKQGGKKTAQTNLARHGKDFYSKIGKKGGASGNTGGFASDVVGKDGLTGRERASRAGRIGGLKSKRNRKKEVEENEEE
jgi:hypothetical protein cdiviTM7_01565